MPRSAQATVLTASHNNKRLTANQSITKNAVWPALLTRWDCKLLSWVSECLDVKITNAADDCTRSGIGCFIWQQWVSKG